MIKPVPQYGGVQCQIYRVLAPFNLRFANNLAVQLICFDAFIIDPTTEPSHCTLCKSSSAINKGSPFWQANGFAFNQTHNHPRQSMKMTFVELV